MRCLCSPWPGLPWFNRMTFFDVQSAKVSPYGQRYIRFPYQNQWASYTVAQSWLAKNLYRSTCQKAKYIKPDGQPLILQPVSTGALKRKDNGIDWELETLSPTTFSFSAAALADDKCPATWRPSDFRRTWQQFVCGCYI